MISQETSFIEFEEHLKTSDKIPINNAKLLYGFINAIDYQIWLHINNQQDTKETLNAIIDTFDVVEFVDES